MQNNKLFDLENYNVKLKCPGINVIEAICENLTPPFKMEIRFV